VNIKYITDPDRVIADECEDATIFHAEDFVGDPIQVGTYGGRVWIDTVPEQDLECLECSNYDDTSVAFEPEDAITVADEIRRRALKLIAARDPQAQVYTKPEER
jgi:hypothetical protein